MPHTAQVEAFKKQILELLDAVRRHEINIAQIEGASTALSNAILINIYTDILLRIENGELDEMELGTGKYYPRKDSVRGRFIPDTDPSRSYALFVDDDGTFKVFASTKLKFPDNSKRIMKFPFGTYKKCKAAFRIDVWPFIPCAELISNMREGGSIERFKEKFDDELEYNNEMAETNPKLFSKMFALIDERNHGKKIISYMEHVQFDLFALLTSNVGNKGYSGKPLVNRTLLKVGANEIEAWRLDLINQLLEAVAQIHENAISHRDLKPENILCMYDPQQQRFLIKIIDFGLAADFGAPVRSGTPGYSPPELLLAVTPEPDIQKRKQLLVKNFGRRYHDRSGNIAYTKKGAPIALQKAVEILDVRPSSPFATYNQGQHDMWSLGVIFGYILKSDLVDNAPLSDELLDGLLDPDAETRLDISQARDKMKLILREVAVLHPDLATQLSTLPEAKPQTISFSHTDSLLRALDHYKLAIITGDESDFKKANVEFSNYLTKLKIINDSIVIRMIDGYISKLRNKRHNIDGLTRLHNEINTKLAEFWPIRVKAGGTNEDDWVDHIEKRLLVLLVHDLTEMAVEHAKGNNEAVEQMFKQIVRYARDTSEKTESHRVTPFAARFNTLGP